MNQRADWLAWGMQFLLGFFIGALLGMRLFGRAMGLWRGSGGIWFIAGVALVGGGIASHYGDRLWLGETYRIIPPDAPQQSRLSSLFSGIAVAAGIVLMLLASVGFFQRT